VLYAFGRHNAICYSPMSGGADRLVTPDNDLMGSYEMLSQLAPLIVEQQGKGTMSAVLLNRTIRRRRSGWELHAGGQVFGASKGRAWAGSAEPPRRAGAIFIATGPDEYFTAGYGVSVTFTPNTPGPSLAGLATVEEGYFENGRWLPGASWPGTTPSRGLPATALAAGERDAPLATTHEQGDHPAFHLVPLP